MMKRNGKFLDELKSASKGGDLKGTKPPFTWSAPIVKPGKNINTNFSHVEKSPKQYKSAGAVEPAANHLAETRNMIAEARAAKRKGS